MEIKVMRNVLDRNQDKAEDNRKILKEHNVKMINMISSPGAGKTTLLERSCEYLQDKVNVGVIEGDAYTDRDAKRLERFDIPIVQINTEGSCHLDSNSVAKALENIDLGSVDVLFVENVGNLICPTAFDLGEDFVVAVLSTTEGHDKPAKYPMLFRKAKATILNKTDLLPYINFDLPGFEKDLKDINPHMPIIQTSATQASGIDQWNLWLMGELKG
ncbi:MAG: hydrogenase nickel incorporation protein HypB [Bacteroidales bacterium]|nr:hydrogenase nickel incorporation protein HypB [Bacteroidales bacterium]